jgi:dolichol-phosphate mannosyltransferase
MPAFSFVVPIYHDGYLARAFCEAVEKEMRILLQRPDVSDAIEVIFVNDGSRDNSQTLLTETCEEFPFARIVELSRNFGQHVAVSCGYHLAGGDYVAMINVDMQDAPDQFGLLIARLRTGSYDIVTGLREERQDSWFADLTSRAFNILMNTLTGAKTPINAASLRVMNRAFVDAYNMLGEKTPYLPGLENWLGFRHAYVPIRHQRRATGKSSYTFRKRLHMARESIISFSDLPLRLAAACGFIVSAIGVLLIGRLLVMRWFFAQVLPGYTSTMSVIVLLGGANLTFLGLIGLYIGRILREVQGRPQYVIKSLRNFPNRMPGR